MTGQSFFHSSFVSFLLGQLDLLEAVLTINGTIRALLSVFRQILAENRGSAVLTVAHLKLAFLKNEQ
jgi:hypothetical protein